MLQIELKQEATKKVSIQTPHYAKSLTGSYCTFNDDGVIVITKESINYFNVNVIIAGYYKNSTPCTREEVESKFKEVINNLKNKI